MACRPLAGVTGLGGSFPAEELSLSGLIHNNEKMAARTTRWKQRIKETPLPATGIPINFRSHEFRELDPSTYCRIRSDDASVSRIPRWSAGEKWSTDSPMAATCEKQTENQASGEC